MFNRSFSSFFFSSLFPYKYCFPLEPKPRYIIERVKLKTVEKYYDYRDRMEEEDLGGILERGEKNQISSPVRR